MCYNGSAWEDFFLEIFDWLFGDTDNEDAQLEDMNLMDMDDEDD